MARAITLAGLRLTFEEWKALGENDRAELLEAFAVEAPRARSRDPRESYRALRAAAV